MKCYKVVLLDDGHYVSAAVRDLSSIYSLIYEIGKTTTPVHGKIFVFSSLDDANRFRNACYPSVILKGEALNAEPIDTVVYFTMFSNSINDNRIRDFWECSDKKAYKYSDNAPEGSMICDSFTPEEMIGA